MSVSVSVVVWLAVPLLATVVAAFAVPRLQRRRSRALTPAQRADRLRSVLAPRGGVERSPR